MKPIITYQRPRVRFQHPSIAGLGYYALGAESVPQALTIAEEKAAQASLAEIETASKILNENTGASMQAILQNMSEDVKKEMMKGAIANTVVQGALGIAVAMTPIPIVGWIIAAVSVVVAAVTTIAGMHNQAKIQKIVAEVQMEAQAMEMLFAAKIREYQGEVIKQEKNAAIQLAVTRGALPEDKAALAPPPAQPDLENTKGGEILDTPDDVVVEAVIDKEIRKEKGELTGAPGPGINGLGHFDGGLGFAAFFAFLAANPQAMAAVNAAAAQASAAAAAGAANVAAQSAAAQSQTQQAAQAFQSQAVQTMTYGAKQMTQALQAGQQNIAKTINNTIQRLEEELGLRERKDNSLEGRVKRTTNKAWRVFDAIHNPLTQWELISGETALAEVRSATKAFINEARAKQIVNWQIQKAQMDNPAVRQNMRYELARSFRAHPTIGKSIQNYWKLQDALAELHTKQARDANPRIVAQGLDTARSVIQKAPIEQVKAAQPMPTAVKGGIVAGAAVILATLLS